MLHVIPKWRFGLTLFFLAISCATFKASAQTYLGAGIHISPTVQFLVTQSRYVKIVPKHGVGYAISGRKEYAFRKKIKTYGELLISSRTLKFYQVQYSNDSVNIWSDWHDTHTGFFTLNAEVGGIYKINQFGLSLGLNVGFMPELTHGGSYSVRFDIDPDRKTTSSFRMQLNLGVEREFWLTNHLKGKARVFMGLSPQDVVNGYTRISTETGTKINKFHMNNSILGFSLYSNMKKQTQRRAIKPATTLEEKYFAERSQNQFSIELLFFKPPATVYHVPIIDQFKLSGQNVLAGRQLNLVHTRNFIHNPLWGIRSHIGIGQSAVRFEFNADSLFTSDNQPMTLNTKPSTPLFIEAASGITRSFVQRKFILKQSLLGTLAYFTPEKPAYLGVPLASNLQDLPPFTNAILEGSIDDSNGRSRIVPGFELRSDICFEFRNHHSLSVGLVINKSYGVVRHGTYKINGKNSLYYGALLQNHGKIGISMAYGF
jgi:hypothetical protein